MQKTVLIILTLSLLLASAGCQSRKASPALDSVAISTDEAAPETREPVVIDPDDWAPAAETPDETEESVGREEPGDSNQQQTPQAIDIPEQPRQEQQFQAAEQPGEQGTEPAGDEAPAAEAGAGSAASEETSTAAETKTAAPAINPNYAHLPQGFQYGAADISRLYVHNNRDYTYIPVESAYLEQYLPVLSRAAAATPDEVYAQTDGGLVVKLQNGTKYIYTLVPTAIRVGNVAYPLSQEDYNALLTLNQQVISTGAAYAQWLAYMSPGNVVSATVHTSTMTSPQAVTQDNLYTAASTLANIQVKSGTGNAYTSLKSFGKTLGNTILQFQFASGTVYTIMAEDGYLYIQSNDMTYGVQYELETSQASINKTYKTFV